MAGSNKAVFSSHPKQESEAAGNTCDALRAVAVEFWFDKSQLRGGDARDAAIRRPIKTFTLMNWGALREGLQDRERRSE